ncbi:HlyD family efflux transporter periplasmic adaptor subunit [bacterium]|nr:HlyD family efflux transporter periplasmic adaptor subunit [bacterium]
MKKVTVRRISTIAAIVLLIGGYLLKNYLGSLKEPPRQKQDLAAQKVETITVQNQLLETDIYLTGRIQSSNKFDVYSEVTGRLLSGTKPFKEGVSFNRGQVLVQLDNTDARLALVAQRSSFLSNLSQVLPQIKLDYNSDFNKWQEFILNFDPEKSISPLPEVSNAQLKNLLVARNVYNLYYSIKSAEAQLSKYTIIAPFNGVISTANINPNTLIRSGQLMGTFLDPNSFELEAGIPVVLVDKVKIGTVIELEVRGEDKKRRGVVRRISQNVDPGTQTAKIYIEMKYPDLYEGMYLSGTLPLKAKVEGVKIPGNLLQSDQTVYIVEDGLIRKKAVHVVFVENEELIISGLENGTEIINQSLTGAVEGNPVEIVGS